MPLDHLVRGLFFVFAKHSVLVKSVDRRTCTGNQLAKRFYDVVGVVAAESILVVIIKLVPVGYATAVILANEGTGFPVYYQHGAPHDRLLSCPLFAVPEIKHRLVFGSMHRMPDFEEQPLCCPLLNLQGSGKSAGRAAMA